MIFVVGSQALAYSNLGVRGGRLPVDIDIVGDADSIRALKGQHEIRYDEPTKFGESWIVRGIGPVDVEVPSPQRPRESTHLLLKYLQETHRLKQKTRVDQLLSSNWITAYPSTVLMMKHSHKYLKDSPHFLKTMQDIRWLENAGVKMPDFASYWLPIREKETYDYAHPSLKQARDTFFKDDFYVYDHDSIHEAVALQSRPAYLLIKDPGSTVNCSKARFDGLPMHLRLATVYEEAAVLALERWMIPNEMKLDPDKGFRIALMKVCTSIASGWWREFAWNHYDDVMVIHESNPVRYVQLFNIAKAEGRLKPWVAPKLKVE